MIYGKGVRRRRMATHRSRSAARLRIQVATAAWERGGDAGALEELAAALLAGGQGAAALELVEAHRARLAGDPGLMRVWAAALRRARRWAEAADAFEALAAADEGGRRQGRAGARGDDAAVHTAGPPTTTARALWARAEALDCRLQERDPGEAADAVRRMLLLPSVAANPYVLALHGRLLMRAGDDAAAVNPLMGATAALPDDPGVAASAAFAVRRAQGAEAGLPLLMRTLRLRADQPKVLAAVVADAVRLGRVAATRRALIELARSAANPGPVWNAVRRLGGARPQAPAGRTSGPHRRGG